MAPPDPADLQARVRRDLGLARETQTDLRRLAPDPTNGGSNAYPHWFRVRQLEKFENDEPIDCSTRSIYRWRERLRAYRSTGNCDKSDICTDLEQNRIPGTDDHRVFIHDNLNSHLAPLVLTTVENRGGDQRFTIVPRLPY